MFQRKETTNSSDDPLSRWFKIFLIVAIYIVGVFYPLMAKEAALDAPSCPWDYGYLKMPVILQTEVTPPHKKVVFHPASQGNGTCVPYARSRTGIKLYGWAGDFIGNAPLKGYTVSSVASPGAIVVTSESGGHVAVVEEVLADSVRISEQNYKGLYVISGRTLDLADSRILGYIR